MTFQITRVSPLKASLVQSLTLAGYISLAGMFSVLLYTLLWLTLFFVLILLALPRL
jgi:hypothetical protein